MSDRTEVGAAARAIRGHDLYRLEGHPARPSAWICSSCGYRSTSPEERLEHRARSVVEALVPLMWEQAHDVFCPRGAACSTHQYAADWRTVANAIDEETDSDDR